MASRYRLSLNARISNLTNHHNYSGFSGVMTSPFFNDVQDYQGHRLLAT